MKRGIRLVSHEVEFGQKCKYRFFDKIVEQGLAINISDALATGVVRDGEEIPDNGIDDPDNVIGRCEDVFDAIEAHRAIKKYGKKVENKAVAPVASDTAPAGTAPGSAEVQANV